MEKRVLIIGAGLSGPLMAVYLAPRGFTVEVYEARTGAQAQSAQSTLSINMTLATRGLHALAEAGLYDQVMQLTQSLKGRVIHTDRGTLMFQPYGNNTREVVHAIKRADLNALLVQHARSFSNITFFFDYQCMRIDKEAKIASFQHVSTRQELHKHFDILIGADGVFSTVRQQMQHKELANYQQEFLPWGYKNLSITAQHGHAYHLSPEAFHMWPRGDALLMAVPNRDGSFACTCVLPMEGPAGFSALQTEQNILELFQTYFPDALPLMPDLVCEFQRNPLGHFITTSTSPWFYQHSIVLIGDACHSFVPFYGQGMNASFEDCFVLNRCIQEYGDNFHTAFAQYQHRRKRNTDAMAELSTQNFLEIRARIRSPFFVLQKYIDLLLNRLFPQHWVPLYSLIMHTTTAYADAKEQAQQQERLKKQAAAGICLALFAILLSLTMAIFRRFRSKGLLKEEA